MNEEQIKKLKERAMNFEKIAKALEVDMKTIDVMIRHVMSDIVIGEEARLNAAVHISSAIQKITEVYK